MSTEKVISGNKLIAEFMGVKRSSIDKFYYYGDLMYTIPVLHPNVWRLSESELKYHTSWDWLMPVCIKLEMETVYTDIKKTYNEVLEKIKQMA